MLLAFPFLLFSFSETGEPEAILRGRVLDSTGYGHVQSAELHFIKNDTTIISDPQGYFQIHLKKNLGDSIVVKHWNLGTTTVAFSLHDREVRDLDIHFQQSCRSLSITDVCPICHSNKNVIPIIYGYPTQKGMRRAKRGKFILGGCMVNDCSPAHYCKKDNIQF